MFLKDLKAYLIANKYSDISRDMLPDKPDECIGLFLYVHKTPLISDGTGTYYVQIQVRRRDGDDAYNIAFELFTLLDSGEDEKLIWLTEKRFCIARPTAGPKKMSTDESGRTVYYTEISFWGQNEPEKG